MGVNRVSVHYGDPTVTYDSPTIDDEDEDEGFTEERKPCGEYHPLPCGVDEDCADLEDGDGDTDGMVGIRCPTHTSQIRRVTQRYWDRHGDKPNRIGNSCRICGQVMEPLECEPVDEDDEFNTPDEVKDHFGREATLRVDGKDVGEIESFDYEPPEETEHDDRLDAVRMFTANAEPVVEMGFDTEDAEELGEALSAMAEALEPALEQIKEAMEPVTEINATVNTGDDDE